MDDTIDIDVNDFDEPESEVEEQESTEQESSTSKTTEPEVVEESTEESEEASDEDTEEESESEEPEEESTEEQSEEDTPEETEDKPQAKNKAQNRIRSLANEKRRLEQEVERLNSLVYKPKTVEQLIEEDGMDVPEARVEALEQKLQMQEFNNHVKSLNNDLNVESLQVLNDFPVFDKDSPEYDPEFARKAEELYTRSAQLEMDENTGLVIKANVLPYDFYKTLAEARGVGVKKGAAQGMKSAQRNLAKAEPKASTPPKTVAKDAFEEGFDSVQ